MRAVLALGGVEGAAVVAATLVLSACSFDLSSHPDSCENNTDCQPGYRCHVDFCVEITGSVGAPDASDSTGGDQTDGGMATGGTGVSVSGTGGTTNAGAGGTVGGTGGTGSTPMPDSGSPASQDAGLDTGTLDVDAGPAVAPYASCTSVDDCNPGDTCILGGTSGVCGAPCATAAECPTPSGTFGAVPACDATGHCRLVCDPAFQWMLPLTCPSGLLCIGTFGDRTCFPN